MRLICPRFSVAAVIAAVLPLASSSLTQGEYFEYSATVSVSNTTGFDILSGNGTSDVEMQTSAGPNNVPVSVLGVGSNDVATGHIDATGPSGTDITFGYLVVTPDSNSTASGALSFDFAYTLNVTDYNAPAGGSVNGSPGRWC